MNTGHLAGKVAGGLGRLCCLLAWCGIAQGAGAFPVGMPAGSFKPGLHAPARIAVDGGGNSYVTEPLDGQVVVLNATGGVVNVKGGFLRPVAIAVKDGNIYVGEEGAGSVTVYDSSWNSLGKLGVGNGEFVLPGHIAVDPRAGSNDVYVCDSAANLVRVYDGSRAQVASFGGAGTGPGQFSFPAGVFVSTNGEVFVVDQDNDRVQVFSRAAGFLRQYPLATPLDAGAKSGRGQGIAGDALGNIYVADALQDQVKVFDSQTNFLSLIGQYGDKTGDLRSPGSVAVGADRRLYVASANNGRVELYNLTYATNTFNLGVYSQYGGASPGNVTANGGTLLSQQVTNSPVPAGVLTQYACIGWALLGNTDSNSMTAGAGTNVTLVLTNHASLVWLWGTNYWLDTGVSGSGTVDIPDSWQSQGSNVTITASAAAHWHFGSWSGATQGCTIVSNRLTAPMTAPRALTANFAIDRYTLQIVSPRGTAVPPPGLYTNDYGTVLSNRVSAVDLQGTTQYVCTGWAMTGNEPPGGTTTSLVMTVTNNAALTWLWKTQYNLTVSAGANGSVAASNGWYDAGSTTSLLAVASNGYHFSGWTGDVTGLSTNSNPVTVTMDRKRSLTASFLVNQYGITATAGPNGSIAPSGTVYVAHGGSTNFVVTAAPHYHVADVAVDGVAVGATNLYAFSNVTTSHTISAGFAIDTVQLTVNSQFGGAWPGSLTTNWGTALSQVITNSPLAGGVGTQYVCVAAGVAGNGFTQASPTNVTLTLTNDTTLTWIWQTNCTFAATAGINGAVTGASNGWYALGSSVTVTGVPSAFYAFAGWSGDVQGDTNSAAMTLSIDQPRSIIAAFVESLAPGGTPDWWLAQYGLTNGGLDFSVAETNDSDGDGLLNGQEYVAGTDPTNAASTFSVTAVSNQTASTLFFQSVTGRVYSLLWRTNVTSGVWTGAPGVTPVQGSGSVMSLGDTNTVSPRYYRLDVQKL